MKKLYVTSIVIGSFAVGVTIASADGLMPVKAPALSSKDDADEPPTHILGFTGGDFTSQGWAYGYAGAMFAPYKTLDDSGFRAYFSAGSGVYNYNSDEGQNIRGTKTSVELLFGYGFETETSSINLLVGPNVQIDKLSTFDPNNPVQGAQLGAMGRADWWINPVPKILYSGEAEYSTAFNTYWVKTQYGYDVTNGKQVFVGPEAVFLGDARYNQWRVGAHVTAVHFGKLDVELSGGYLRDSDLGSGAYGMVEFNMKF